MDADRLRANLNEASKRLRNAPPGLAARGYEAAYAIAYQQLVKAGLAPQLRGKYRP